MSIRLTVKMNDNIFKASVLYWTLLVTVLPLTFLSGHTIMLLNYLLLGVIIVYNKFKLYLIKYILLCVFTLFMTTLRGDSDFYEIINIIVLPSLFIEIINSNKRNESKIYLYFAISLYLVNCVLSILEYHLHLNFLSWDLSYFDRHRSTGLWIHPLFNALIHSITLLFILQSKLHLYIKTAFYIIGIYTIFTFDARAATLMLFISSILISYEYKYLSINKAMNLVVFTVLLYIGYDYLSSSELGGKLFDTERRFFGDSGSMDRLTAIEVLLNGDISDIINGVSSQRKQYILKQNNLIAFENSITELTYKFGIITTTLFFVFYLVDLFKMMKDLSIRIRIILLSSFVLVGVTSTALANSFVWCAFILSYYSFRPYDKHRKKYLTNKKLNRIRNFLEQRKKIMVQNKSTLSQAINRYNVYNA